MLGQARDRLADLELAPLSDDLLRGVAAADDFTRDNSGCLTGSCSKRWIFDDCRTY